MAFANSLLPHPEEYEIVAVKYFTARVNYNPQEPTAQVRQSVYLEGLAAFRPELKIVEGYYKRFRARFPFAKEPCKSCDKVESATVWKTEEKRSDVNLATEILIDQIESEVDCVVLISGDTDFIAPLYYLKKRCGKKVLVFNPHERPSEELRAVASYYKHIPRDLPARCQLPYEIEVGTHGRIIRCPEEVCWLEETSHSSQAGQGRREGVPRRAGRADDALRGDHQRARTRDRLRVRPSRQQNL